MGQRGRTRILRCPCAEYTVDDCWRLLCTKNREKLNSWLLLLFVPKITPCSDGLRFEVSLLLSGRYLQRDRVLVDFVKLSIAESRNVLIW